jgi:hypothetical protein
MYAQDHRQYITLFDHTLSHGPNVKTCMLDIFLYVCPSLFTFYNDTLCMHKIIDNT